MTGLPPRARPADRYGGERADRGRRRATRLAAAALAAAFLAFVGWAALGQARQPVRWQLLAFDTSAAGQVTATIRVTADPADEVACDVVAQDRSHRTIGVRTVTAAPGDRVRRVEAVVPVRGTAVTAVVEDCRLVRLNR